MTTLAPSHPRSRHAPQDRPARPTRPFKVGTTGWTVEDLDDPKIERQWEQGSYEIVEGVLARMPAAFFDGVLPLTRLQRLIIRHLDNKKLSGDFGFEVDFVVDRRRVAKPDMIFLTPTDLRLQAEARARGTRKSGTPADQARLRFGRFLVPPTLVVESISIGHEDHDQETKRRWYAEARVPYYWLLNAYQRSLECLVLKGKRYRVDQAGRDRDEIRPSAFPGLVIPLGELWDEEPPPPAAKSTARK
jgi:Uma2 family endonuclease